MTRTGLIVLGCALVAAGGCVSDRNARPVLGSNVVIGGAAPAGVSGDTPSVRGLDRSNWAPTALRVPVDGTVHRPAYARHRLYDESLARQKGLYPTSETALELEGSRGMGGAEIAAQPVRALVDVVAMPLFIAMDPPWKDRQSPDVVYKRRPPGGWLTGGGAPLSPDPAGARASEPAAPPPATGEVLEVTP